jgi:predicted GH43/DUF377 family glycosyl hydrolase
MKKSLISRYSGNPILTKDNVPYPVEMVYNAAVVKHNDEYIIGENCEYFIQI